MKRAGEELRGTVAVAVAVAVAFLGSRVLGALLLLKVDLIDALRQEGNARSLLVDDHNGR